MVSNESATAVHELQQDGKPFRWAAPGWFLRIDETSTGRALCSCGGRSPELNSDLARQEWHRDHAAGRVRLPVTKLERRQGETHGT